MSKKLFVCALCVAACFFFAVNAIAAETAMGKCVEFNAATKMLKLEVPGAKGAAPATVEIDCSAAKMAAPPAAGDLLKVSFNAEGNAKKAVEVTKAPEKNK
ncbi:MAG: hypothetical protein BWK80_28405 [Desulfobacteraceae bacterium IS3]|nr:MAG: hypothetical protein BWK80_28405 [Desulfobacteraceae bacterium IS3]